MSTGKKRKAANGKKPAKAKVSGDGTFMMPAEVIKIMNIHPSTFYRLAKKGEFPGAVKIGESWRILAAKFWREMETGWSHAR